MFYRVIKSKRSNIKSAMHILRHVLDDGDEKNRERPSSFLFAKERRDKERERKATFSLSRFPSAKIISKQNWILSLSRSCRDGWMHRKRARKRAISLISFRANAKVYARSDDDDDDDNSSSGGSTERERKKKTFYYSQVDESQRLSHQDGDVDNPIRQP